MATTVDAYMAEDLRVAIKECEERCLYKASQWASELLSSIPEIKRKEQVEPIAISERYKSDKAKYLEGVAVSCPIYASSHWSRLPPEIVEHNAQLDAAEEDEISMARTWIEMRSYSRVAIMLQAANSPKARFLLLYSQYLVRKPRLASYKADFEKLLGAVRDTKDPWLLYMKGLFLLALDRRAEAIECAMRSIVGFPWNWAAWELLADSIRDVEELYSMRSLMPVSRDHVLMELFHVFKVNELHSGGDRELAVTAKLLGPNYFPNNPWIYAMRGCILYYMHDLASSKVEFEQMLTQDPWRIDNIDVYSFALHVTHNAQKLSRLSREYLLLAKDRPEVCSLVANYFSLQGRNDLATLYFNRATQLDPNYLSAWTLMGHELIEQKNSHAAIETYRRAIDIQRDDFRAWYGLGQAYELLNMHDYALFYYQHATALSPYDLRMWLAQGQCYEELGRYREALECYRRALIPANPHDDFVLLRLAKVHAELGEEAEAVAYHRRVVEMNQANGREVLMYAKSAIEVADYQMRVANGDLELAKELLIIVAASNSEDVEQATTMLKKLQKKLADTPD